MSKVMIDTEVWDLIKTHYKGINDSGSASDADRRVISYILDKELAQFRRESYLEDRARTTRLQTITRA